MRERSGRSGACAALLLATLFPTTQLGCATPAPEPERPRLDASAAFADDRPPEARTFDARRFAEQQRGIGGCELGARGLLRDSPDDAWAALRACIALGAVEELTGFTHPAWSEQWSRRPDALQVLLRLEASRGGDPVHDLKRTKHRPAGVLSLAEALQAGEKAAGRPVLFRARVEAIGPAPEGLTRMQLSEVEQRLVRPGAAGVISDRPPPPKPSPTAPTVPLTAPEGTTTGASPKGQMASPPKPRTAEKEEEPEGPLPDPIPMAVDTGLDAEIEVAVGTKLPPLEKDFVFVGRLVRVRRPSDVEAIAVVTLEGWSPAVASPMY